MEERPTGVKKDSATNRARAFNCIKCQLYPCRNEGPRTVDKGSRSDVIPTYKELHLRYLLVHLLHELYDKVNQFVL